MTDRTETETQSEFDELLCGSIRRVLRLYTDEEFLKVYRGDRRIFDEPDSCEAVAMADELARRGLTS